MINFRNVEASRYVYAIGLLAILPPAHARALDEISYGLNWQAQAEQGGFYQAVVDGTYERYGLKVNIIQGGPASPNRALLVAGKVDFYMGGQLGDFDAARNSIPTVSVAAIFQKDPQVLIAHPDQGIENFHDIAKLRTIFMARDGFATYFDWMKANFTGFRDEQFRLYTFNPAAFIADSNSAQQGYLTSEPYEIEMQTGWKPKVFLIADQGFNPYATMITTTRTMIETRPDLVQRFVDASIEGWHNYLHGDNAATNDLIKRENPDITDGQIAYSIAKMKEYGIVESGDAVTKGIGCMSDERYAELFSTAASIGIVPEGLDYHNAYTLQFVCKGNGRHLVSE